MKRTASRAHRTPRPCSLAHLIDTHDPDSSPPAVTTARWGYACLRNGFRGPYACVGVFSPKLGALHRLLLRADVKARSWVMAAVVIAGVTTLLAQALFSPRPLLGMAATSLALVVAWTANAVCAATVRVLERQVAYTACDLDPAPGAPLESLLARIADLEQTERDNVAYAVALGALHDDVAAWPAWATVYDPPTALAA